MSLRLCALAALPALFAPSGLVPARADVPDVPPTQARLHNGWKVSPAGQLQKFGDMPLGGALSPDKSTLAVTNAGFNQHHLYLLDAQSGAIKQTFPLTCTWNGVAWAKDGKTVYAAGGSQPQIYVFRQQGDGTFAPADPIALPDLLAKPKKEDKDKQALVSGLAVSQDGKTLFVANFATDTLYALNLPDGTRPHAAQTRRCGASLLPASLPGRHEALRLAGRAGQRGRAERRRPWPPVRTLFTDSHPNDLCFGPDGSLYVSCGSSDSVVVFDPKSGLMVRADLA